MRTLFLKLWRNTDGQDMIEYALVSAAGFIAVAAVLPTDLMPKVIGIFQRLSGIMSSV